MQLAARLQTVFSSYLEDLNNGSHLQVSMLQLKNLSAGSGSLSLHKLTSASAHFLKLNFQS
jgi:hypothetical protein